LSSVIINDVGPRDGLQNQQIILSPDQRAQLVGALLAAGLKHIEVGAFVSSKAVPAMAGTDTVLAGLPRDDSTFFTVLVPNFKGYQLARDAGAKSVSTVLYGTDAMAQANVRMSRTQAEQATIEIIASARQLIRPSHGKSPLASWRWAWMSLPSLIPSAPPTRSRSVR
jgi:hydroxymethylglutaryl-CoA lyase